jgi:predicted GTPase
MIMVMGVTGAGKSYLVNKLLGGEEVEVGQTLEPCMLFAINPSGSC